MMIAIVATSGANACRRATRPFAARAGRFVKARTPPLQVLGLLFGGTSSHGDETSQEPRVAKGPQPACRWPPYPLVPGRGGRVCGVKHRLGLEVRETPALVSRETHSRGGARMHSIGQFGYRRRPARRPGRARRGRRQRAVFTYWADHA